MNQSNEEKLVRHSKAKDIDEAIVAALTVWMFSGVILSLATGWAWMFNTWWGTCLIGLPYGALLIYGAIWGVNQRYR